jgi:hypothetical protein
MATANMSLRQPSFFVFLPELWSELLKNFDIMRILISVINISKTRISSNKEETEI